MGTNVEREQGVMGKKKRKVRVRVTLANCVSCFPLHFFHALAASCLPYNRTQHSQTFFIVNFQILCSTLSFVNAFSALDSLHNQILEHNT